MTPTLVLSPRFSSDSNDLWRAAVRRGWEVHRAIRCRGPEEAALCCVFGEVSFCDIMAERLGLGLLEPPVDWLGRLPLKYINRKLWTGTVADLGRVTERSFIKPANDKLFERAVYEKGSDVPIKYVDADCPIVVSEVVAFSWEVRLHIKDRQVVTAAEYMLIDDGSGKGSEDVIREATEWTGDLLADPDLDLPSAVVLDVGFMEGIGMGVVEANSVYASGIYNEANRDAVLDLVLRGAGPYDRVSEADRKYLRNP